jgi:hypothetical protein
MAQMTADCVDDYFWAKGQILMSARLLFEVALRILGVWFVFTALNGIAMAASIYLSGGLGGTGVDPTRWFFASGISVVVQSAFGLGLILCAANVAARFYPEQVDATESQVRVGPGDIYHIACFVLGAFVFVLAVEPAGRIVNAGLQGQHYRIAGDAFTMIVFMSTGILLVFGASRIGKLLSGLRYDPDSVANQQFSVKILLILTGLVAVLLGVARWLALKNS